MTKEVHGYTIQLMNKQNLENFKKVISFFVDGRDKNVFRDYVVNNKVVQNLQISEEDWVSRTFSTCDSDLASPILDLIQCYTQQKVESVEWRAVQDKDKSLLLTNFVQIKVSRMDKEDALSAFVTISNRIGGQLITDYALKKLDSQQDALARNERMQQSYSIQKRKIHVKYKSTDEQEQSNQHPSRPEESLPPVLPSETQSSKLFPLTLKVSNSCQCKQAKNSKLQINTDNEESNIMRDLNPQTQPAAYGIFSTVGNRSPVPMDTPHFHSRDKPIRQTESRGHTVQEIKEYEQQGITFVKKKLCDLSTNFQPGKGVFRESRKRTWKKQARLAECKNPTEENLNAEVKQGYLGFQNQQSESKEQRNEMLNYRVELLNREQTQSIKAELQYKASKGQKKVSPCGANSSYIQEGLVLSAPVVKMHNNQYEVEIVCKSDADTHLN